MTASTEQETTLTESLLGIGLFQVNDVVNENGRLLDLVFISDPSFSELIVPPTPLMKVDSHHKPLLIKFDYMHTPDDSSHGDYYDFDFRQCDYALLNERIASVDWSNVLAYSCPNTATVRFYNALHQIFTDLVPRKLRRFTARYKHPWLNEELTVLRNQLRKKRKRINAASSENERNELRGMEEVYEQQTQIRFQEYIESIQRSVRNNPSAFWSYVKSRKNNNCLPTDVSFRGHNAATPDEAANFFADFFKSVYSTSEPPRTSQALDNIAMRNIHLPQLMITPDEVINALTSIDASKGSGPDGLPPNFVKNCAHSLVHPVAHIFNLSLSQGTFPDLWKIASITPIFKAGNFHQVENYRPISILSCLAKVLEKFVYDAMFPSVQQIVSDNQHGFMRKRSTTTNLLSFTQSVISSIEKRQQVDAVYVDFAKAFDKVPHSLVIEKLHKLGFPDWIIAWLRSYLTDRKAYVNLRVARSDILNIPSGVPQGSHIGPLIFILFVNDICSTIGSSNLMYADDLKLYRIIHSPLDCCALQADVDTLLRWCTLNGMEANISKCKVVTFCRIRSPLIVNYAMDGQILERVNSIRDLGVLLDSKLRFNEHIASASAKAFAMLGFLKRNTADFDDPYSLKTLFCALVRSILEYAVVVWAPYHAVHVVKMERIQRAFVRFALRRLPWDNPIDLPLYEDRCRLINLPTLADRRTLLQRLFIFDVLHHSVDCNSILSQIFFLAPARQLREPRALLWVPAHQTSYGYNNPLHVCIRKFNEVCPLFYDFNISKSVFKLRIC